MHLKQKCFKRKTTCSKQNGFGLPLVLQQHIRSRLHARRTAAAAQAAAAAAAAAIVAVAAADVVAAAAAAAQH